MCFTFGFVLYQFKASGLFLLKFVAIVCSSKRCHWINYMPCAFEQIATHFSSSFFFASVYSAMFINCGSHKIEINTLVRLTCAPVLVYQQKIQYEKVCHYYVLFFTSFFCCILLSHVSQQVRCKRLFTISPVGSKKGDITYFRTKFVLKINISFKENKHLLTLFLALAHV